MRSTCATPPRLPGPPAAAWSLRRNGKSTATLISDSMSPDHIHLWNHSGDSGKKAARSDNLNSDRAAFIQISGDPRSGSYGRFSASAPPYHEEPKNSTSSAAKIFKYVLRMSLGVLLYNWKFIFHHREKMGNRIIILLTAIQVAADRYRIGKTA